MPLSIFDLDESQVLGIDRRADDLIIKLSSRVFTDQSEQTEIVVIGLRMRQATLTGEMPSWPQPLRDFQLRSEQGWWEAFLPEGLSLPGPVELRLGFEGADTLGVIAGQTDLLLARPATPPEGP